MGSEISIGDEAEQFLAALTLATPEPHECLRCFVRFVRRSVSGHGCDGGLRFVRRWLRANPSARPGLPSELGPLGAYCDCEVVLNVFCDEIPSPTQLVDCPSMKLRATGTAAGAGSS